MADDSLTISFEFRNKRFNSAYEGLMAFGQNFTLATQLLPSVLKTELLSFLNTAAATLAKRHGNPWPGGTSSSSLSRRSGALLDAIKNSVKVYGSTFADITGEIGAPVIYGRIQEYGGTIRPRNGKYLTIPLPAALNDDGTPKKQSARDWDSTFIIRSRNNSLLIVTKNLGDIVPLYVLKEEVYIPPRLNMGSTLRSGIPYFTDRAIETMMKQMQAGLGK